MSVTEPVYRVGDPAPPPLPRRTEAEVMARWQGDKPVVSILCATYQHVGFIEDALRGFLGQDTDFPFEILVRDDASTDGTADIVRDYADRFPNIIRALLETENQFAKIKPSQVLGAMARGELIAMCEGDDYWIEPMKLQAQALSLLANHRLSVVVHPTIRVRDGVIVRGVNQVQPDRFSRARVLRTGVGVPCAMMFRSGVDLASGYAENVANGDDFLGVRLGMMGDAYYNPDLLPAVQRTHEGGIWSLRPHRSRRGAAATSAFWTGSYLADRGWIPEAEHWFSRSALLAIWEADASGVEVRGRLIRALARDWVGRRVRRAFARVGGTFAAMPR